MATAPHPKPRTDFEKWKDTIDRAKGDARWDVYDTTIQSTVAAYNAHLRFAKGFNAIDWKLVKAMVWTETGPHAKPWSTRPMQIGNSGDPGLAALLGGKEGGELIMPPDIKGTLTETAARNEPIANIQAGIGYLVMRLANFANLNTEDETDTVHDYTAKPGDSLDKIARRNESTRQELEQLNPGAGAIKIGQVVRIRKAKIKKTIVGFKVVTNGTVAKLYNTKDKKYAEKLAYCLAAMP